MYQSLSTDKTLATSATSPQHGQDRGSASKRPVGFCVHAAERFKIQTTVHTWNVYAGLNAKCMTTTRFNDPFLSLSVTMDDKWCCYWPQKGGHVLQDADGHGNSLTSTSAPACVDNIMAWIAPSEPKILLVVSH